MKKSGAWYTYDGEQLGQGRENAKTFLAENPEVMVEISERIRQQAGIGARPSEAEFTASDDEPISLEYEPESLDARHPPGSASSPSASSDLSRATAFYLTLGFQPSSASVEGEVTFFRDGRVGAGPLSVGAAGRRCRRCGWRAPGSGASPWP